MPYPSPVAYPSPTLYPGFGLGGSGQLIAFGGIVLGMKDAYGVSWSITKFDGWDGTASSTTQFTQRARSSGATASEGFNSARYMTIEGHVRAPSLALLEDARDQLNAAVTLTDFDLLVSEARRTLGVSARRQGAVIFTAITDTLASFSILIGAKDPRKFGDLVTATTRLPFSSGGLVRPSTWPRTWTGVSGTGKVTINNPGNTQAPCWLRIDGPLPAGGWTITHQGKQTSLTFATALALGAGEFVTVDMDRREVLAQGQAPRSGYVTSRGWFSLDPGDNVIAFSAQNYSETASLTVTTKPSWQ